MLHVAHEKPQHTGSLLSKSVFLSLKNSRQVHPECAQLPRADEMEPHLASVKFASVKNYKEQNVGRSLLDRCSRSDTTDPTLTHLINSSSECNRFGVKSVKHKFAFRLRMSLSELFLQSAICFMFLLLQASVFSSSFANATSSWGVSGR